MLGGENMSLTNAVLSASPYLEVLVRHIYWNVPFFINLKGKPMGKTKRFPAQGPTIVDIIDQLQLNGISNGDLIVVHSSFDELQLTGASAKQVIDSLIHMVGVSGTLAMPAFPYYKNAPKGRAIITKDITNEVWEYSVKKTPAWTGLIPNLLMRYPGAVRSRHPLNSMVAVGPLAEKMMEHNLKGFKPLPCGENSSWGFCARNSAKIKSYKR